MARHEQALVCDRDSHEQTAHAATAGRERSAGPGVFHAANWRRALFAIFIASLSVAFPGVPIEAQGPPDSDARRPSGTLALGLVAALGRAPVDRTPELDANADGRVTVDELILAKNRIDNGGADTAVHAAPPAGSSQVAIAPSVDIGSATGSPGQQVTFGVVLHDTGVTPGVAGLQNDIAFDSVNTPIAVRHHCDGTSTLDCSVDADCPSGEICVASPDCQVNPDINKNASVFGFMPPGCSGAACTSIRALVFAIGSYTNTVIPDGATVYTCNVNISPSAPPNVYPLAVSNVVLAYPYPPGGIVPGATGNNGQVVVTGAGTTLTPTAVPTPPPPSTSVDIGRSVTQPGGIACIPVTLTAGGNAVAATSNDIGFDSSLFAVSSCTINPAIGPGSTVDKQLATALLSSGLERIGVFGNATTIPDGLLYTCHFAVGAGAGAGTYSLSNVASAADANGGPLPHVGGAAGQIVVTTCTGDCDGNSVVTPEEVEKCVDVFLGLRLCNDTDPTLSCPAADANVNGAASIGEVVQCVIRFLSGCPGGASTVTPTPTPTPSCAPTGTPYCSNQCPSPPSPAPGCAFPGGGVCIQNPQCGANEVCVGSTGAVAGCCTCATVTPTPVSDCCSAHASAGCLVSGCTSCVCGMDPYCCNYSWDYLCASEAANQCAASCLCSSMPTPTPITPTATRTPTQTGTRPTSTPTPPPPPWNTACGNGTVDTGEECDDGGTCIGGSNAGIHCTAESQCQGNGVCIGGSQAETACAAASDCPGGNCVHCVPQGGDGCAANCTTETDIVVSLVNGQLSGATLIPGTSGAILYNEVLGPIALPFVGAGEALKVGRARNGVIPVVVPAASVHFPQIDVSGLACACVRGVAAKTCGGMLFNADGSAATDCTPGYTAGDSLCTGGLPCTFVHGVGTGAGNSASGIISCNPSLQGVNLMYAQDSKGSADLAQCNPSDPNWVPGVTFPECGAPPVVTLYGTGPAGSGVLLNTMAISEAVGTCANPGNLPPNFCTDQEAFQTRGMPATLPSVTGIAAGIMFNINQFDNDTLCNCPAGLSSCTPDECIVDATHPGVCSVTLSMLCTQNSDCPSGETCAGALSIVGAPLPACTDQLTSVSGIGLAGAFTSLSNATIGDVVVTNLLVGQ